MPLKSSFFQKNTSLATDKERPLFLHYILSLSQSLYVPVVQCCVCEIVKKKDQTKHQSIQITFPFPYRQPNTHSCFTHTRTHTNTTKHPSEICSQISQMLFQPFISLSPLPAHRCVFDCRLNIKALRLCFCFITACQTHTWSFHTVYLYQHAGDIIKAPQMSKAHECLRATPA